MDRGEINDYIIENLKDKLALFDISPGEIQKDFDLVKSGLLDSMAFIDLLADVEEKFQLEIDFEKAAEEDDFTSLGGMINIIMNLGNA
ncbi:MAG: hypothetical protein KAT76_00835 [Bacteroidales bacterium]|nr:hypothetical protein [Bacteroidales bacterium]